MYSAEKSSSSGKRSAEGNSNSVKRMNYYVPRDEIKSCKKPLDLRDKPRCKPRILIRRFALIRTAYKYLNIGISVRPESFVELHLGDIRGNHIILPHETWEIFIKRRVDIERFLQLNTPSSLRIEYLVMEHVKIHDTSIVKLTVDDFCLYMKPATILFLFELEHCVNHEYLKLYENTEDINASFDQFVRCLQSNMPSAMREDAVKILRDVCDKTSIIDCELVAYAVDELLCETLKRGDIW
ncbi:hypothetical protein ACFW04_008634 [Cataglyphis niger]